MPKKDTISTGYKLPADLYWEMKRKAAERQVNESEAMRQAIRGWIDASEKILLDPVRKLEYADSLPEKGYLTSEESRLVDLVLYILRGGCGDAIVAIKQNLNAFALTTRLFQGSGDAAPPAADKGAGTATAQGKGGNEAGSRSKRPRPRKAGNG